MKLIKNFRNELLKRKEIVLVAESDSNPTLIQAKEIVAKELKSVPELISIRSVKGNFGRDEFSIDAFIYDSKEKLEEIEPKPKKKEAKK